MYNKAYSDNIKFENLNYLMKEELTVEDPPLITSYTRNNNHNYMITKPVISKDVALGFLLNAAFLIVGFLLYLKQINTLKGIRTNG